MGVAGDLKILPSEALQRSADQALQIEVLRRYIRRMERNEDEEMSPLGGCIVDKGHYPQDVVS